jgi:hypothetical protein
MLADFDVANFWEKSDYADHEYVDEPVTDLLVAKVERSLGYQLPRAYVTLMKSQNGGTPRKTCHRAPGPTSWAEDHVALHGIAAIGAKKTYSLCGAKGSSFWTEEWGYPSIGIYFADCPSAGHDMFCLDYRECGARGEPKVVHVDQERDYKVTLIASNFEAFIRGLESEDVFESPDVKLDAAQVKSVWIDPDFAAKHGLQIPASQRHKPRK